MNRKVIVTCSKKYFYDYVYESESQNSCFQGHPVKRLWVCILLNVCFIILISELQWLSIGFLFLGVI